MYTYQIPFQEVTLWFPRAKSNRWENILLITKPALWETTFRICLVRAPGPRALKEKNIHKELALVEKEFFERHSQTQNIPMTGNQGYPPAWTVPDTAEKGPGHRQHI